MKLNIVTFVLIILGAFLFVSHALGLPWTPLRILGMAIAIPSILLVLIARVQLGRSFSVRARASELVTTGLYSRIRNPIYVFASLALGGVILYFGKFWWFLVLAAVSAMQVHRSRKEAEVLTEKFGAEYLEYKRKTWF